MRGDALRIALGAAIAAAIFTTSGSAASLQGLAQEKAAAVSLLRTKAEHYAAALAHGRLFSAYLNASTMSEGNRVKARLASSLEALRGQFGLTAFHIVDRGGEVFLHVGAEIGADVPAKPKKKKSTPEQAVSDEVAVHVSDDGLSYVAPVLRQDAQEFTLTVAQDLAVYTKILSLGAQRQRVLAILDERGQVLADNRAASALALSDAQLKQLSKLATQAETGETMTVETQGLTFNLNRQPAGQWTVVAIEAAPSSSVCPTAGAQPCL